MLKAVSLHEHSHMITLEYFSDAAIEPGCMLRSILHRYVHERCTILVARPVSTLATHSMGSWSSL